MGLNKNTLNPFLILVNMKSDIVKIIFLITHLLVELREEHA